MKLSIVIILIFVLSYFAGQWLQGEKSVSTPVSIFQSDCDLKKSACEVVDGVYKYSVQFEGEVSPLKPFTIFLKTDKPEPISVNTEFLMEGMDMGFTKQPLLKKNSNWQAEVILPVCSLGRKDWILKLSAVYASEIHQLEFKFSQE